MTRRGLVSSADVAVGTCPATVIMAAAIRATSMAVMAADRRERKLSGLKDSRWGKYFDPFSNQASDLGDQQSGSPESVRVNPDIIFRSNRLTGQPVLKATTAEFRKAP